MRKQELFTISSTTVKDVANYFIWRANADEEFGENITNLKLQKLVYYAQGFHLAWYGTSLVPGAY